MLSALKGAITYINASKAAGTPDETMASVVADRLSNLTNMVAKSSPAIEDVTSAIETLGECTCFSQSQKSELLKAIHAKMHDGVGGNEIDESKVKSQTNLYVENYMTNSLYIILEDKSIAEDVRVEAFVDFLHMTLGCKFPDMPTRKRIIAITCLLNGSKVTSRGAKAAYDLFARINKRKRDFRKHIPSTCKNYPQDPQDFIRLHPMLYKEDDPPVAPRLSTVSINECVGLIAARGTNSLLKSEATEELPMVTTPRASAQGHGQHAQFGQAHMMQGMQQTMQMFGQFMHMMGGNVHGGSHGVAGQSMNLRFTPPGAGCRALDDDSHRSPSPPNPSNGHTMLALPNAPHNKPTAATPQSAQCEEAQASTHMEADEEDDIDAMIGSSTKPDKKVVTTKEQKSVADAKGKQKVKKASTKADKVKTFPKATPPPCGTSLPCIYNGCKIYGSASRFRIVPFPGKSVYDYAVPFKHGKQKDAWKKVIEFCKKPKIPEGSVNAI